MPTPNARALLPATRREADVAAHAVSRLIAEYPDLTAQLTWRAAKIVRDFERRTARERTGRDVRGRWAMRPVRSGPGEHPGRAHVIVTWGQRHRDEPRHQILCGGSLNGGHVQISDEAATLVTDPPHGWEPCHRCVRMLAHLSVTGEVRPRFTDTMPASVLDLRGRRAVA